MFHSKQERAKFFSLHVKHTPDSHSSTSDGQIDMHRLLFAFQWQRPLADTVKCRPNTLRPVERAISRPTHPFSKHSATEYFSDNVDPSSALSDLAIAVPMH
jgi:hypothetical protein